MIEKMDENSISMYYETHERYYRAILPCGYRIDRLNNEVVDDIFTTLHSILDEIRIIKRQISAHDYNIENKIEEYKDFFNKM